MKKVFYLILICIFSTSFASATETLKIRQDEVFLMDDVPFEVHKSRAKELREMKTDYNEYGKPTFKQTIVSIFPTDDECENIKRPQYLFDDITTKYFEKGPIDSLHTGFAFRGALNIDMVNGEETHTDETYSMIENHFRGYLKDGKTSFNLSLRYAPRSDVNFMQFLVGNAFISHQITPHNRIVFGNSRTHTGEEGSKQAWAIPLMSYSQIGRNFGNIRKFGVRVIGDYDLVEYDLGGYSSDTYFREFFPGAEFTGWVNFKPLGKTDGRYGKLKLGGGISSGHNGFTYNVAGAYARYEYKKFKTDFEFSNAEGYNGNLGLSEHHARGMYTTVYYRIHPKLELLARYDRFQPKLDISNGDIKEYVVGANYFIKGQGLKLILNYVYRQNSFTEDSHRIILGTQIML